MYDVLLDYSGTIFQIIEQDQKDFQTKEVVRLIKVCGVVAVAAS